MLFFHTLVNLSTRLALRAHFALLYCFFFLLLTNKTRQVLKLNGVVAPAHVGARAHRRLTRVTLRLSVSAVLSFVGHRTASPARAHFSRDLTLSI